MTAIHTPRHRIDSYGMDTDILSYDYIKPCGDGMVIDLGLLVLQRTRYPYARSLNHDGI